MVLEDTDISIFTHKDTSKVLRTLEESEALACFGPKPFESLARNFGEIDRYIRQLLELVKLYESEVEDGEASDDPTERTADGPRGDEL